MTRLLAQLVLVGAVLSSPRVALAQRSSPAAEDYTVVVVGGSHGDGATAALKQLQLRLRDVDPKSAVVIFTGNYSAQGLPPEAEPGRAQAEAEILAHVTATGDFVARGGRVYFLPGDRDFPIQGTKEVRRLRKFLNRSFEAAGAKEGLDVMPNAACGTTTLLDLTDKVGLLLLNSQWWMQEPAGDPELNEGCVAKTGRRFFEDLTDALREYRGRRLIVASHHPIASYGELGGAFGPAAHFTPAPLVGSAWVFARQSGLVAQHQNHPRVRSYVELLHDEAETNGGALFASGHDANLQYLAIDHQTQVISGSTAQVGAPTVRPGNGEFAAASSGWAELVFEPSGAGAVHFFSPDGASLFAQQLPPMIRPGPVASSPPPPLPEQPVAASYSTKPVWQLPGVVRFFTGSFYSEAFALKLPYQLLDLQQEEGGLTPIRIGGGIQTNSLRLRDARGGEWSMRSTTKDATRLPPYPWNRVRPLERMLDYGYTATHPEAALAVAPLAAAVGVLHPRPRLMYLPDQEALGEYRGLFGNELVLLEQRARTTEDGELPAHLGGRPAGEAQPKIRAYDKMVDAVLENPATHQVDQEAMLRARLLDMLIGDWDRHRGQWRFAATEGADGITHYVPIALDRDQAFPQYDGAWVPLAQGAIPRARSLHGFTADYGSVAWLNYNARDVDPFVLNRIPHDRWMAIASEVQAALTNQVIDEAMATWRPETYALDGARIAEVLKARRDTLPEAADTFYAQLSKNVDVLGSAGDDVFELWFGGGDAIRVVARAREAGSVPYFERTFQPTETAELRLYALEGDDLLSVHGAPHRRIAIGFVGGEGHDRVAAAGVPPGAVIAASAIRLFDSPNGAQIDPSISVQDERSAEARLNQYEPEANHEPSYGFFFPSVMITSGSENWVGGTYTHVFPGFKKHPFGSSHQLSALLATTTLGLKAEYRGLFPESLGLMDQQLDVRVRTPSYTRNFYGLTNAFVEDADTPDFYRVRQAQYQGGYGLFHSFFGDRARLGAQLSGASIVTEATEGRFVTVSPDVSPDELGSRYFVGARLIAEVNTFDNLNLPRRGLALSASAEGRYDVQKGSQFSTTYRGAGAAAIPFDRARRLVLLSRVSAEGIVGEHPFYFAPTVGGSNLRAYNYEQLAGEVSFVNSNDLRLDVYRIEKVLPGTIGVSLGLDHGRVFGPSITNDTWHLNVGGGLWWSLVDEFGISASYFRGLDGGSRFTVQFGPLFANPGT